MFHGNYGSKKEFNLSEMQMIEIEYKFFFWKFQFKRLKMTKMNNFSRNFIIKDLATLQRWPGLNFWCIIGKAKQLLCRLKADSMQSVCILLCIYSEFNACLMHIIMWMHSLPPLPTQHLIFKILRHSNLHLEVAWF